jgi:hypothetical protein
MSAEHRPSFRIHRIDRPHTADDPAQDTHYRAFWKIDDTTYRVHVWSTDTRESQPNDEQRSEARNLDGKGWMLLKPIEAR